MLQAIPSNGHTPTNHRGTIQQQALPHHGQADSYETSHSVDKRADKQGLSAPHSWQR